MLTAPSQHKRFQRRDPPNVFKAHTWNEYQLCTIQNGPSAPNNLHIRSAVTKQRRQPAEDSLLLLQLSLMVAPARPPRGQSHRASRKPLPPPQRGRVKCFRREPCAQPDEGSYPNTQLEHRSHERVKTRCSKTAAQREQSCTSRSLGKRSHAYSELRTFTASSLSCMHAWHAWPVVQHTLASPVIYCLSA
jgi:hypothetical protein